jgi:hypothetical protein
MLTFDKDFGELARGSALPRTCGVALLWMPMPKPEEAGLRLAALITTREDWAGKFLGDRARPRLDATARVVCGPVEL